MAGRSKTPLPVEVTGHTSPGAMFRDDCSPSLNLPCINTCLDQAYPRIRFGLRLDRRIPSGRARSRPPFSPFHRISDRGGFAVSQPWFPPRRPEVTVHPIETGGEPVLAPASSWELTLANQSSVYLQAQVFRQHLTAVAQTHPGLRSQWTRASDGGLVFKISLLDARLGEDEIAREIPLPEDLRPGERMTVLIPTDRLPSSWAGRSLRIEPSFSGVGQVEALAETADLKISIKDVSSNIVRTSRPIEPGKR